MEAQIPYSIVALAIITISCSLSCFVAYHAIACPLTERNLLMEFKARVIDEYNELNSWHGFNCCTWSGVSCNVGTGHVSVLDLSAYSLKGDIHSTLFELAELERLDLSVNEFQGNISPHVGMLKKLSFLDLSYAGDGEFYVSLQSLSNLVSLKYLFIGGVSISESKKSWGEAVGSLHNLQNLRMPLCGLQGPIPHSLLKLTSLLRLDLSYNSLSAVIPSWFQNVTAHLLSLDLSYNYNLGGDISFIAPQISPLLTSIDLSWTAVEGKIPSAIGNMSAFESLRLSYNNLIGLIPPSLGTLSSLSYLNLGYNQFSGPIPRTILDLVSLSDLYLDSNG